VSTAGAGRAPPFRVNATSRILLRDGGGGAGVCRPSGVGEYGGGPAGGDSALLLAQNHSRPSAGGCVLATMVEVGKFSDRKNGAEIKKKPWRLRAEGRSVVHGHPLRLRGVLMWNAAGQPGGVSTIARALPIPFAFGSPAGGGWRDTSAQPARRFSNGRSTAVARAGTNDYNSVGEASPMHGATDGWSWKWCKPLGCRPAGVSASRALVT